MRRLTMALALTAMTLVGTLWTPALPASASMPGGGSQGSTTLTVGPNSFGEPTWTVAFAGQFTAGGQTYTGSATGAGYGGHSFPTITSLAGSSSTGTISGYCSGAFVEDVPWEFVGGVPPTVVPDDNFTGVILFNCTVSINGRPYSSMGLRVGLLPTTNAHVFKGLYAETTVPPDTTGLPSVPLVSDGLAGAITDSGDSVEPSISFEYIGQITLGGRAFHGTAWGSAAVEPATSVAVPSFPLTPKESNDTLSATCSGQWRSTGTGTGVGIALAVLTCNGAVNGGPPGTATLVSVYAQTSGNVHPGETEAAYTGVFAGV